MSKIGKQKKTWIWLCIMLSVLLLAAAGMLLLKKISSIGGISHIYNYTHDTVGSILPVYDEKAVTDANKDTAYATEGTKPLLLGITTRLRVNGEYRLGYERAEQIFFTEELAVPRAEGLLTFRGNYYRSMASYGTANISEEKFDRNFWSFTTGKLLKSSGTSYWSGNGWTGQPLVVRWDEQTIRNMNLYEEKKAKEGLTEVIYSGMDGYVHFLDLEDGTPTRDPIHIGMVFKGTATIHPDGIPLLVLGSGDAQTGPFGENVSPAVYIYSLLDGSKLYEFGANDEMAPRIFHAFDSSPVIDAKNDVLLYPSENGILYTLKLNTSYDKIRGKLSIEPEEFVDFTYSTNRATETDFTWGMENSACVNGNYLYTGDNGGVFYCIDLNTMNMVWAQDVYGDVNSSPIFERDADGNQYVYVATTLLTSILDEHSIGEVAIYKLNAVNGEIIWKKAYECHNIDGIEGGILATGVLGHGTIDGQIIYSVSRTPKLGSGMIVSLDTKNGEEVWTTKLDTYAWSSTATMYTDDGRVYLVQCCANGDILLMNAANGMILDSMNFGTTLEATPAVFENMIVVGTRDERIIGIRVR